MGLTEADAVIIYANCAEIRGLDIWLKIEDACLNSVIGTYYNNPSFCYSDYCLPKATKQLQTNYADVSGNLIENNRNIKDFIDDRVLRKAGYYNYSERGNHSNSEKHHCTLGLTV